jgi:CRISPR system Cascade subunit CasD
MPTLLLRLTGPMQSWGTNSRFSIRDTGLEPSKSGVIGLLCAALGKPRDESTIENAEFRALVELQMAVRVDREGVMRVDYHTAQKFVRADGTKAKANETIVSNRYYLSDACFVVALTGQDETLLRRLNEALAHPYWQLSLGRKAFLPSAPVQACRRLHDDDWLVALKTFAWQGNDGRREKPSGEKLRLVFDATPEDHSEVRHDLPLSLALGQRRFLPRYVKTDFIERPKGEANGDALSLMPETQFAQTCRAPRSRRLPESSSLPARGLSATSAHGHGRAGGIRRVVSRRNASAYRCSDGVGAI